MSPIPEFRAKLPDLYLLLISNAAGWIQKCVISVYSLTFGFYVLVFSNDAFRAYITSVNAITFFVVVACAFAGNLGWAYFIKKCASRMKELTLHFCNEGDGSESTQNAMLEFAKLYSRAPTALVVANAITWVGAMIVIFYMGKS